MKIVTSKTTRTRPRRSSAPKQRAPRGAGSVTQLPSGKWEARVRRFGRDKRVRFDTQAEAVQHLETMRRAIGGKSATLGKMRFGDWLQRYRLQEAPSRKERTRKLHAYYQALAQPSLGHIPLSELDPNDLRGFQKALIEKSASTQRQTWHFVSAALRRAFDEDVIVKNPAEKVRPPKGGRKRERIAWTRDETAKALVALEGHRLEVLVRFMLTTGVRPGEALALRWKDVDASQRLFHIRQTVERAGRKPVFTTPKTEKSQRRVPLHPETLAMLEQHRKRQTLERAKAKRWTEHGLIFPSSVGTPLDHRLMRPLMKRISKTAGVRLLTPHELRHTYRTLARLAKVDTKQVSSLMGHTSERTTEIYDHAHEDTLEQRAAAVPLSTLAGVPFVSLTGHETPQNSQTDAKNSSAVELREDNRNHDVNAVSGSKVKP
jgi:integrase